MRLRDQPTAQVTRKLDCSPQAAWAVVTDIELPIAHSPELEKVAWVEGEDVAVGNRFRGFNRTDLRGPWDTVSIVAEVEDGRRWTWEVDMGDGPISRWGFEVDPAKDGGCTVKQFVKLGLGRGPLDAFIDGRPESEGFIVDYRLREFEKSMAANLDEVARRVS